MGEREKGVGVWLVLSCQRDNVRRSHLAAHPSHRTAWPWRQRVGVLNNCQKTFQWAKHFSRTLPVRKWERLVQDTEKSALLWVDRQHNLSFLLFSKFLCLFVRRSRFYTEKKVKNWENLFFSYNESIVKLRREINQNGPKNRRFTQNSGHSKATSRRQ